MHGAHRSLRLGQFATGEYWLDVRQQLATRGAQQQIPLGRWRWIAQRQAHQEAIQLRFRQRKGAALAAGILRGNNEERRRQRVGDALVGHLPLFHRLQQRALAFRRGAVDFVGQHQLGKDWPGMEGEMAAALIEHRGAENVARQQVGGELDALEAQPQHPRQGMAEGGLAHAGQVLDQQMPPGQQAGHGQPHLRFLAQHHLIDCRQATFQFRAHAASLVSGRCY